MVTSCSKETTTSEFTFEEKEFVVSDADEATYLVQNFLAAVPYQNAAASRTTFSDTDINEGRWLLEASGNYEKNANFANNVRSNVRHYTVEVDNVSNNGTVELDGADLTSKFAGMLATAEADRQGGELVAGFDVKITETTAVKTKFNVNTFFVVEPPYNCAGVPNNEPDPIITTNLFFVGSSTLACLNQHIYAENENTITALENCQSAPWVPDLYYVSVDGDLPFADLVIDEGGRRCSSNGECLKSRPESYTDFDITVTVKEYVENEVRIVDDIAHDIENEIAPPAGTANVPGMFLWRVNLTTTLRPDPNTGGTSNKWYNEIRDVSFAKYLIACD